MPRTLYNNELNLEYYHVPKNAITTMFSIFEWVPCEDVSEKKHTFCILRDPVDRLISSFLYVRNFFFEKDIEHHHKRFEKKFLNSPFRRIFVNDSLEENVKLFFQIVQEKGLFDIHIKPQGFFLTPIGPLPYRQITNIDFFLNFNNLQEDFNKMCDKEVNLPMLNKNFKQDLKVDIMELFQPYIPNIQGLYWMDFELWRKRIIKN